MYCEVITTVMLHFLKQTILPPSPRVSKYFGAETLPLPTEVFPFFKMSPNHQHPYLANLSWFSQAAFASLCAMCPYHP